MKWGLDFFWGYILIWLLKYGMKWSKLIKMPKGIVPGCYSSSIIAYRVPIIQVPFIGYEGEYSQEKCFFGGQTNKKWGLDFYCHIGVIFSITFPHMEWTEVVWMLITWGRLPKYGELIFDIVKAKPVDKNSYSFTEPVTVVIPIELD